MAGDRSKFISLETYNDGNVTFGDNKKDVQSGTEDESDGVPDDEDGWTKVSGKSRVSSLSPRATDSPLLQLTPEDVAPEIEYWSNTVVCYVLGANPPWELLSGFINRLWGKYKYDKISFLPNGAFLVHFPTLEYKNLVLQQGFPMYDNKPLIVKPWAEDCSLAKERVKKVPIWIKLCGLSLKFWGASSLEKISSLIGKFMICDEPTMEKTRLGYARIMVEVEVGQQFPEKIYFNDEKGIEVLCKGIWHISGACKKASVPKPKPQPQKRQEWRPVQRKPPVVNSPVAKVTTNSPVAKATTVTPGVTVRNSMPSSPVLSPVTVVSIETKIKDNDCSGVLAGFGLQWRGVNNIQYHHGGRVSLIWIDQIFDVHIMSMSDQHITARVTELASSDTFLFTVVYGSNDDNDRLKLWEDLKRVKDNWRGPWDCVDYCELVDIKAQGAYFTLNNKHDPTTRVFSRLDRVMINLEWMNMYPDSHAYFLLEGMFDHNPSICYRRMERQHRPHFRYFNMWGQDPHFLDIIKHTWQKKVTGSWMFQVVTNQRNLKQPLKQLNRARFADVEKAVEVAKLRLSDLQSQIHKNPTNHTILQEESDAAEEYKDLCRAHHSYLSQKAKVAWLCEGDENSKFFHNQIKSRQMHNKILQIKDTNGLLHTDLHNIEKAFLGYYQDLLGSSTDTLDVHVPTVREGKLVTEQHRSILLKPVSIQEVKEAIFSFPATKSPGNLLKQLNTTTLTLIPKVKHPVSVLEYRPIACCNVLYKWITKILCTRLSEVLPIIVHSSQGGFIKGRNIVEKCLDLPRLSSFIQQEALRFPSKVIHLIMTCVTSPSYSLNVNGNTFGFFQGKRGLRQGDPMSPLIFTLCMEYLSRILDAVAQQDGFRFHPMCGQLRLNYLLFADDLLLFCKGNDNSIMWILKAFSTFSSTSGLSLNKDKTDKYFNGVKKELMEDIVKISGFRIGTLPFKYLGVPISSKKITKFEGHKLIERIVLRIRSLGARHLSYAGRLILEYTPPPDCSWSWKKIAQVKDVFKAGYTGNQWQANPNGYTVAAGYNWLRVSAPKVPWRHLCWNNLNVLRTSFIFWASQHNRRCMELMQQKIHIRFSAAHMVNWFSKNKTKSRMQRVVSGACFVGLISEIWHVRNCARLSLQVTAPMVLVNQVWKETKDRLLHKNRRMLSTFDQQWLDSIV
ncbi:uncharacterized protein LOC141601537 [Silene latifolia]|uniref:uncharacterized protein LOC141601537 n=1 Tax=Silene latifolia TaxID=37657 RepID=UPI003D786B18